MAAIAGDLPRACGVGELSLLSDLNTPKDQPNASREAYEGSRFTLTRLRERFDQSELNLGLSMRWAPLNQVASWVTFAEGDHQGNRYDRT